MEPLYLKSKDYGLIKFFKIASQIVDNDGNITAWLVNLNIVQADNFDELWTDLHGKLTSYVNWSRYAPAYDKLLLEFDEYRRLVDLAGQFSALDLN